MHVREPSLKAVTLTMSLVLVAACKGDDGGGGNDEGSDTGSVDSSDGGTTAGTSTSNGSQTSQTSADTSSTSPTTGMDTTGVDDSSGGGNADVQAFRFSSLVIRDPHFYADVTLFGCTDVTDEAPLGMPGVNDEFDTAINTDDPMMPDGALDLSLVLVFRPLDQADAAAGDVDFANGTCLIPVDNTICELKEGTMLYPATYTVMASGTCLEPDPANLSSQGYDPAPGSTMGPCFTAGPTNVTIVTSLADLPLENATIAAQFVGDPADSFVQGTLQGTLTEAVANATELPADLQMTTGATYIGELLPGGMNNCAGHDDRDGAGWVFHVDFTADLVPWNR
jgi:hypothetical protein